MHDLTNKPLDPSETAEADALDEMTKKRQSTAARNERYQPNHRMQALTERAHKRATAGARAEFAALMRQLNVGSTTHEDEHTSSVEQHDLIKEVD